MLEDTIFVVVQYQHILLRIFFCLTNFWRSSKWASVFRCTLRNGTNQRDVMKEFWKHSTQLDMMVIILRPCWLVFFTSKFKAITLVLHVHCIIKISDYVWSLKFILLYELLISAWKYWCRHVPPVKSFSHVNSNKSSCTIVVLFCKI